MSYKSYIITYDEPGLFSSYSPVEFHKHLTRPGNGIVDWWHYFKSTYIVIVTKNVSAEDMYKFLSQNIPNKTFFVSEINLKNHNGLMQQEAWDWINKYRNIYTIF